MVQNQQRQKSLIPAVLGVCASLVLGLMALISYRVQLWPWEFTWLDLDGFTSVVVAVLIESKYEAFAITFFALNLLWFLVRQTRQGNEPLPSELSDLVGSGASTEFNGIDAAEEVIDTSPDRYSKTIGDQPDGSSSMPEPVRSSNAQLQIANAELSRIRKELVTCKQQLDTATQARAQFLNNMSHELRTPMNGIMGMTELLLNGDLPERERRFATSVATSSEALLSIINDLLDYSKIESGTLYLERSRFNVRTCAEDVCALLAPMAQTKGVELICYVDDDIPMQVDGDANRIRQVLNNLINNAISFTSSGEIVVRLTRLDDVDNAHLLQCDVQDTGAGIAPELQASMFEAFTQADSSTTRKHGGLGMGLAISQQLVAMMGGNISFRSRLGEGTRFTFTLQLGRVSDAEQEIPSRRSLHGARALVVDDNETNRTILFHQLSNWGVDVDTVEGGAEALAGLHEAHASKRPYDVLILDLHMPHMDGIELAQAIANTPELAGIKSLMLTSALLELDVDQLSAIGIDKYISKPARQSVLHDSLVALMPHMAGASSTETRNSLNADEKTQYLPVYARVLLAEDNAVNQDVAINMLEQMGCTVDLVADGKAAIERCKRQAYDIIFMDCQMPTMDGFEATTAIKNMSGSNASTPIVALTANAMSGDRERCLDHGMDDYLGKPVRQEQIHQLLVKWAKQKMDANTSMASFSPSSNIIAMPDMRSVAGGEKPVDMDLGAGGSMESVEVPEDIEVPEKIEMPVKVDVPANVEVPESEPLKPASPAVALINEKAINNIRSLQRPGKDDLLTKVVNVYFDKTPALIEDMVEAGQSGDLTVVKDNAHSLKSSSAYLGADTLSKLCKEIESAVVEEDTALVVRLAEAIAADYEKIEGELNEFIKAA